MKKLTVVYDAKCRFCNRCRWWLEVQPKFLEMEFLPAGGPEAQRRFPDLPPGELSVVSDEGGVYLGAHAWVMCLYALEEWREWSERLAHPAFLPLVRGLFELVSNNRYILSSWLEPEHDTEMVEWLSKSAPPACAPTPRALRHP